MTPILNRRLVLEAARVQPDGAGGYVETWSMLGELWAEIRPGTGTEAGDIVSVAQVPLRITVRAAPFGAPDRPVPNQRLREGGRVYRIVAVAEADPRGRYLICYAREETAS